MKATKEMLASALERGRQCLRFWESYGEGGSREIIAPEGIDFGDTVRLAVLYDSLCEARSALGLSWELIRALHGRVGWGPFARSREMRPIRTVLRKFADEDQEDTVAAYQLRLRRVFGRIGWRKRLHRFWWR